MTRGRGLLVLVLALLPALTSCGSSSTTTVKTVVVTTVTPSVTQTSSSTATTSAPSEPAVYFLGVAGRANQRPSTLELTGDGTLYVAHVQWSSWGGPEATGTGNAIYHGCTPNCAQAPVHTALVSIRLFSIRSCSERDYYSGVTLTLNSGQLLDKDFLQRSWSPC